MAKISITGGWPQSLAPASAGAMLALALLPRAARSRNGKIPELGDPRRRRLRPQHANRLVNKVGVVEIGGIGH
jgi:hypothetical protein